MKLWNNPSFGPMLLKEIDKPFNSKDYLFEIKYDGIRALIFAGPKTFRIRSRNKKDLTHLFPELKSIQKLVNKNTILDGEIIVISNNLPSFKELQKRIHLKNINSIRAAVKENPVIFMAFDILYYGISIIDKELLKRKEILNKMADTDYFYKTKYYLENGKYLYTAVKKMNLEGIVAKKIDSIYEIDKRTNNWVKIKNINVDNFYIGGYVKKSSGYLSLLIGRMENNKLFFVGKVTLSKNKSLYNTVLKEKVVSKNPFINNSIKNAIYIKPNLTCHVRFLDKTDNFKLRHPILEEL